MLWVCVHLINVIISSQALAHQQLHSTGKSTMGSLPRLSELGRAGTFDFGTPNVDPHPKRSLGEAARPGALCPSCSGGRNALKVETWCQTPLTSFRQDEDVLGRLEADRPKRFVVGTVESLCCCRFQVLFLSD